MTDETTTNETTAAPPIVRRKRGRPKRAAPPPKPAGSPYEGISANSCAYACVKERCVITHTDMCGRGTLQPKQMMNPAAVRRKAEAMAFIAHKAVDKKAHR